MRYLITILMVLCPGWTLLFSGDLDSLMNTLSHRQMQADIEFLGHDLLEGRAPGTRGAELAEGYVKAVFKGLDIEPWHGDYFHPFPLKGYTLKTMTAELAGTPLAYSDVIVGGCPRDKDDFLVVGDVVFAGFGIRSTAWNWDDYKDVDVKGKILLIRVNEPGRDNPDLFEGEALTYFGRWSYKIEEAARRGARGILLIHTDETAGYGWHVVRNSWTGEDLYLPAMLENDLEFRGWIQEAALRDILGRHGVKLNELYQQSEKREFKPQPLPLSFSVRGQTEFREFETRNVVGFLPGMHPEKKKKAILLSAHTDHLGMDPDLEGDQIYNGAIDNGSAVAAMLACARILKAYQSKLDYSVIFLGCQAEESGLLGSYQFAGEIDPAQILCNINFESTPVWEASTDFMGVGARFSSLEELLKIVIKDENLAYSEFSMKNSGFFYRSDQFSFARKGIPGIWISAGESFVSGQNRIRDFFTGDYHTVRDEYDLEWPLESFLQTVRVTLRLVDYINRHDPKIEWKGKMTFPLDEK